MSSNVVSIDQIRSQRYEAPLRALLESKGFPDYILTAFFGAIEEVKKEVGSKASFYVAAQQLNNESRLTFQEGGTLYFTLNWTPEPGFIALSLLAPKLLMHLDTEEEHAASIKVIQDRTLYRYIDNEKRLPAGRAVGARLFKNLYNEASVIYHIEQEADESAFVGVVIRDEVPTLFSFETMNSVPAAVEVDA